MSKEKIERTSYTVGCVLLGYDVEYNCYRCCKEISMAKGEPVFHVSNWLKNGDLSTRNYHLSCAPKKILKHILSEIRTALKKGVAV